MYLHASGIYVFRFARLYTSQTHTIFWVVNESSIEVPFIKHIVRFTTSLLRRTRLWSLEIPFAQFFFIILLIA